MDRRDEAAIEAVKAYYQQDLSQAEVAARMGISRPTVAKLLAHGRARGFVTVEIHDPREEASELALRLQERFALACVRVAHGCVADEAEAISQVGRVGAELVARLVRDDMSVGISWGRTMSAVASHLARSPPGCARRPAQGRNLLLRPGDARLRDHARLLRRLRR